MSNPAAWHPDPTGKHDHRWWDGERWTEHVSDAGQASVDPIEGAPASGEAAAGHDPAQEQATQGTGAQDTGAHDTGVQDGGGHDDGAAAAGTPEAGGSVEAGSAGAVSAGWSQPEADPSPQTPSWEQPQQPAQDAGQTWQQPAAGAGAAAGAGSWQQDSGQSWQSQPAGAPSWQQAPGVDTPPATASRMPLAAMLTGLLSIPALLLCGLGVLSGIVGIVLGFIALSRIKRDGAGSKGQAWAGIIGGFIAVVIGAVVISLFASFSFRLAECIEETGDEDFCAQQFEDELMGRFGGM